MSDKSSRATNDGSSAKFTERMRIAREKQGSRPSKRKPIQRPVEWAPFHHAPAGVQRRFIKGLQECYRRPTVAIKLFCIECMGYSPSEPRYCGAINCVLWPYNRRMFKTGKGGEA